MFFHLVSGKTFHMMIETHQPPHTTDLFLLVLNEDEHLNPPARKSEQERSRGQQNQLQNSHVLLWSWLCRDPTSVLATCFQCSKEQLLTSQNSSQTFREFGLTAGERKHLSQGTHSNPCQPTNTKPQDHDNSTTDQFIKC